jgi:integrase
MSDLSRNALRKLAVGERVYDRGVVYERLANNDGRWSIDTIVAGTRHRFTVGRVSEGFTETQARDAIVELKARKREAQHGQQSSKTRGKLTLAKAVPDYLAYLEQHNGRDIEKKRRRFELHLTPALGEIALDKLQDDDWLRYVSKRKREKASVATINRERSALLHLLNTAKRRKLIREVRCSLERETEPPSKMVYLTPEQAQRLLAAAEQDSSEHALPFCMVALYTGMRQSPVLNLRVRDVNCDARTLWIRTDKAGARAQPMPALLADYLRELIADRAPDDFLFASGRAANGRLYQANGIFARCVERAGLSSEVTPHSLRHTAATLAAQAGLDAATIQAMHGWKSRSMAERYTHSASLSAAMDRLGERISPSTTPAKSPPPTAKRV